MGKPLFKHFKLHHGAEGSELVICDGYTDQPICRQFLWDSELEGLYYTLRVYLKDKGIIENEDDEYLI